MTVLFFAALLFKESSLVIISFWAGVRYFCCASVLVIAARINTVAARVLFMAQNWGAGGKRVLRNGEIIYPMRKFWGVPGMTG